MLIPLLTLLLPLMRFLPPVYRWRIRARIYRWYKQLRAVDAATRVPLAAPEQARLLGELSRIEEEVKQVSVPLSYAEPLYHLRLHIELLRSKLRGHGGGLRRGGRTSVMIRIERPAEITTPLVFDSPHSGRDYPPDFDHRIDRQILRQAEDSHVEALFAGVVRLGAPLLHALFPRSYIDPNRALEDLDGGMIDGPWPGTTLPGDKTRRGVGLIWRRLRGLGEIYDRRLTVAEVQHRIETCWHPYHAAPEGAPGHGARPLRPGLAPQLPFPCRRWATKPRRTAPQPARTSSWATATAAPATRASPASSPRR